MKRIIAIILSLILLLGCGTVAVSADSSDEIKDGYRYGEILVQFRNESTSVADILIGFEIETVRLLTPGSSNVVYQVIFAEKTKDIVWRAIDVLNQSEKVQIAEPNYIGNYLPVEESENENTDYLNKLSPALLKEINTPTDDLIEVYIFLKDCPAKWHVDELVSQKYIWSNEQEHLMYYRQEMKAVIGPYVQQFIDDNADLLFEIICQIDSAEFIIASVTKENAVELAKLDIVQDMDTYGEYSDPTWISEMIAGAANEMNFDPRHTVTPRDINVLDYYHFDDVPAFAVYFTVRNLCYIDVMIEERIGDWLLVSSHPEPYLYINDRLYGFKEAYDEGLMTNDMLEELAASDFRGGCSYPILTRYIKGDADGDGEVSIIDATVIQRYEASITTGAFYKPLADVDGDSDVTVIDATLIQREEAGLYTIG